VLSVGDISIRGGGPLAPHFSHRSGRDADLLFYVSTLDGAPVQSPGFVHFDPDGLAWDPDHKRYLRLDVEREWLLVEALLTDPDARIQWLFVSRVVEALLLEWARAKGVDYALWARAEEVMLQPNPGGVHDDHLHVRTACSAAEITQGCEHTGPMRAWLVEAPSAPVASEDETTELISFLVRPLPVSDGTILSTTAPAAR
jgi:penicillin-insensitive murein endopeptidase